MSRPDEVQLCWGITLDHVERVTTRIMQKTRGWMGADRREVIRLAILETVYTATEPPTTLDLYTVGRAAAASNHYAELRAHGMDRRRDATSRAAAAYWYGARRATPSHEPRIVEHVALWQCLQSLAQTQQDALVALAAFGNHSDGARALGISKAAFAQRIMQARRRFLQLWHQGETPSPLWQGRGQPHSQAVRRLWRRGWNRTSYERRKRKQP